MSSSQAVTPDRRQLAMGVVGLLYFAQGFPNGLITQALPAILRDAGYSRIAIGWAGALMVPWSFKWMWARLVNDRYWSSLGRSRSWIIPTQLIICLMFALLALMPPSPPSLPVLIWTGGLLFIMVLASATQDIATDGMAVRLFGKSDPHLVNSLQVSGVKLGAIFGGGGVLMVVGNLGWTYTFSLLCIMSLACAVVIILFRDQDNALPVYHTHTTHAQNQPPEHRPVSRWWILQRLKDFFTHYQHFWRSREMVAWLIILCTYRLLDGFASGMVKPFMVDIGISLKNIGMIATIGGGVASITGAIAGGWLLPRVSRFWSLVLPSLGLIACVFVNALMADAVTAGYLSNTLIQDIVLLNSIVEHLFAAMALVAIFALAMHYTRHAHAGSDFTVQVSLMMSVAGLAHVLSGYVAQIAGYTVLFVLSGILGLLALIPVMYWRHETTAQS